MIPFHSEGKFKFKFDSLTLFQIMLRVVPFQQRTLGIGVHWTFLRLLGFFFVRFFSLPCTSHSKFDFFFFCFARSQWTSIILTLLYKDELLNWKLWLRLYPVFRIYPRWSAVWYDDWYCLPEMEGGMWKTTILSCLWSLSTILDYYGCR